MSALPDLPCRVLVELVTEHLEGTLDPATEQVLVQHLGECLGCADHVEQVRTTVALTAALPAGTVPDDLRARLSTLFRRHR